MVGTSRDRMCKLVKNPHIFINGFDSISATHSETRSVGWFIELDDGKIYRKAQTI